MITIKQLSKKSLFEFIYSNEYSNLEHVPISRHRALSHINNPRAQEDDTLLYLAYEEEQLVGYLGVLPDTIYYNDRVEHCGWLSCLWVDSRFRGKQIAYLLLQNCVENWKNKLLATEFTGPAKSLYDKSGSFDDLETKAGIRLYIRSDLATLLPPKNKIFKNGKFFLNIFDKLFNALFDVRFHFYPKKINKLELEYVNYIDNETNEFIKNKQQKQLFKRSVDELNWILKYPWVLSAPGGDRYSHRYYFSSIDQSFDFIPVKVYDASENLIAFLIFAKRNNYLKLPYCYYGDNVESVINVINYHIVQWRIKIFTTFNTTLASLLRNGHSPAILKKEIKRGYIIGSTFNFDEGKEGYEIQDGDGDCCFT